MKTLVAKIVDKRRIELVEEKIRLLPHQVLIKHLSVAPSIGTSLRIYRGEHSVIQRAWIPRYPVGVEGGGVGEIVEVGKDVKGAKIGELVSVPEAREFSVKQLANLVFLPEDLDIAEASFLMQAQTALHGVRRAAIFLGDMVLIMGQGAIGCFAAQFAKMAGARKVITTDLFDSRLEISKKVGADFTINASKENVVERVKEITKGKGADLVIDVSGSPQAFKSAAIVCRTLGKLVIMGWFLEPFQISICDDFTPKGLEMVVCAGRDYLGDWKQYRRSKDSTTSLQELSRETGSYILELIKEKKLRCKELITQRFKFEDTHKAYELSDKEPSKCLGIVIEINKD